MGEVPVGEPPTGPSGLVDVRLVAGVVTQVQPGLFPLGSEEVVEAGGRWLAPGLWDAHVHLREWAATRQRLDVSGTSGSGAVIERVVAHLAQRPGAGAVLGFGHRSSSWSRQPTVAELDAVSGDRPVALVSGDGHNGWLNSAALHALGLLPREGPLEEAEWFAVAPRLDELTGGEDPRTALRGAVDDAAARGVVGIGDMGLEPGYATWPGRVAAGVDTLRVCTAVYPDGLDDVLAAGLRTGQPLKGTGGLVTMGPLKVIFDGSVGTRTAYCCRPYAGPRGGDDWRGTLNVSPDELTGLCRRAAENGLEVALHAIGDAAVHAALDAVAGSGARGSLEHVQLLDRADLPRFAALGLRASVQPAHLVDDRDVMDRLWPDAGGRAFALRSLLAAGADLRLGSDAPVAPLDPWEAMAAAVSRSGDDRPAWTPEEAITPAQALAASTNGRRTVSPGSPGDLALLDTDPLAPAPDPHATAALLRDIHVAATFVAGRATYRTD